MVELHPTDYEVIVLGTGLEESIIAAAASTSGLSVLHLDNENEYGSQWAGLGVQEFMDRLRSSETASTSASENLQVSEQPSNLGEMHIHFPNKRIYSNIEILPGVDETQSPGQCIIDLAPRLLYTAGAIVDSLLRLKAENYLVFRLVKSYFLQEKEMKEVPASRADIFKSKDLKPAEKRVLMRFLKSTLEALQARGSMKEAFAAKSFAELLEEDKVPAELQAVVLYSLAMLDSAQASTSQSVPGQVGQGLKVSEMPCQGEASTSMANPQGQPNALHANLEDLLKKCTAEEGIRRMSQYVSSASEQGGAFMTPDYGTGELPQAFCRVSAVAGATYMLRAGVVSLLIDAASQACKGVKLANGQTLTCRSLVANAEFLPSHFMHQPSTPQSTLLQLEPLRLTFSKIHMPKHFCTGMLKALSVSRAVVIWKDGLDSSCKSRPSDQFLLTVPPGALAHGLPPHPVRVLQLGKRSLVAPDNKYITYFSSIGHGYPASAELRPMVDLLLPPANDRQLTAFFSQCCDIKASEYLPQNVALCQPPGPEIGFAEVLARAQGSYKKLFGRREFLPEMRQPQEDPESIDLGG